MKHYRKVRGEYFWLTDLGLRITANDLINNIKDALKKYKGLKLDEKRHTSN